MEPKPAQLQALMTSAPILHQAKSSAADTKMYAKERAPGLGLGFTTKSVEEHATRSNPGKAWMGWI